MSLRIECIERGTLCSYPPDMPQTQVIKEIGLIYMHAKFLLQEHSETFGVDLVELAEKTIRKGNE